MSVEVWNTRGVSGLTVVADARLAYVQILRVTRSGRVYKETDSVPAEGSMEFLYDPSLGEIAFDPSNPFYGPTFGRPNRNDLEKITIMYKIP